MSKGNFLYSLNLLRKSGEETIKIMGGEPTLHPKFKEYINIIANRGFLKNILIFTNGAYDDKLNEVFKEESKRKRITLLINFNNENDIGSDIYNKVVRNIKSVNKMKNVFITLGLNLYDKNQRYDYFLDMAEDIDGKDDTFRWSVTVSNNGYKKNNPEEYFIEMRDIVVDFLKDVNSRGLGGNLDSNNFPPCFFSSDNRRELEKLDYDVVHDVLNPRKCEPVIDVKPNLDVIRCFVFKNPVLNLMGYDNISQIERDFKSEVDDKFNKAVFEKCKKCDFYKKNGRSCVCLSYF
jgi:MoaA/NifB/PqqE/SkfB family radical SAM enzyme